MARFASLATLGLVLAAPAGAVTFTIGAPDSGPVDVTSLYAPGYTMINFNDGTSPFVGGKVETGGTPGSYAVPYGDTTPYFSVGPSTSSPATLAISGINQLSFYWGSIDSYNTITFNGLGVSFNGLVFDGNDGDMYRNAREITFHFSASEAAALTGITLSSTTNAFELDNLIFGNAVPEPATWGFMLLGLGLVGAACRVKRQQVRFATC